MSARDPASRGAGARLGWTALGTIIPGVGLIGLGRLRTGFALYLLSLVPGVLLLIAFTAMARIEFLSWSLLMGSLLVATLATYLISLVLTWRASRERISARSVLQRWYSLVGLIAVAVAISNVLPPEIRRFTRSFYIPSESMLPTLQVNDRIVTRARNFGPPVRGKIVVYRSESGERVGRIAGIEGDIVSLRGGILSIDDTEIPQRPTGEMLSGDRPGRIAIERLLGERGEHRIADQGYTEGDNFGPVKVPSGHVFILGDNRDSAADSRFGVEEFGVGMVPITDIVGVPEFIYWSDDRSRIGKRLNE